LSKVVVMECDKAVKQSVTQALKLIQIDDLNTREKPVVVKVGVFNPKAEICTTVSLVDAIINAFDRTPKIFLAESDSYNGEALKRLQIWNKVFNARVIPFSLSTDKNIREVKIAGEKIPFSHTLFKPNVFISTHVPRRYENAGIKDLMNMGSILKNLLGLIPDIKKDRFHEKLATALLDIYEAIGGIDLAVLDGTYTFLGVNKKRNRIRTNVFLVGRDAISVEAVGAYLVGFEPMEMPVIQEAINRGLGEGDINKIEVLGSSVENLRQKIIQSFREMFPKKIQRMRG